jgi:hypothetical protein
VLSDHTDSGENTIDAKPTIANARGIPAPSANPRLSFIGGRALLRHRLSPRDLAPNPPLHPSAPQATRLRARFLQARGKLGQECPNARWRVGSRRRELQIAAQKAARQASRQRIGSLTRCLGKLPSGPFAHANARPRSEERLGQEARGAESWRCRTRTTRIHDPKEVARKH